MTSKQIIDEQKFPCGCRVGQAIVNAEPVFFMEPCSKECTYYKYMLEEAARQNKPIEEREEL